MGHVLELYGRLRLCSDVVISCWQRGQQWFETVNVLSWASDIMHEASSGAGQTAYPKRLFCLSKLLPLRLILVDLDNGSFCAPFAANR